MKWIFTFLYCFCFNGLNAQWAQYNLLTFDPGDVDYKNLVFIDTTSYHSNIWQIGKPNKTVFTSANSAPNAIMTDTLNPYPINDTSVFILKIPGVYVLNGLGGLSFKYWLDIDSGATAKLELSSDSGNHWINLMDSIPPGYSWYSKPRLDTSTNGWETFEIERDWWMPHPDTFLFRFTFISDSLFANKDGWMIDNISFEYLIESVPKLENNNLITLYPNPTTGNFYLHSNNKQTTATISIYDIQGKEVYKEENTPPDKYLNLQLPNGLYTLRYATGDEYCVKRLVIHK